MVIDRGAYGPVISALLAEERLPPLGPGQANEAARPRLAQLNVESAFAHTRIRDRKMADCCVAGLWLHHNFLEESHRISQDVDTVTGSYWHGILHRREPDFDNARYWFRRVGSHPVFEPLRLEAARQAGQAPAAAAFLARQSSWDAPAFVQLCEMTVKKRTDCEALCVQVQKAEWDLLFDYCYGLAAAE